MTAATLSEIEAWYGEGESKGASHMIIACDSFDYEDYAIFVMPGSNPRDHMPSNGDKVMECYSFALGWESQSKVWRAQNWE